MLSRSAVLLFSAIVMLNCKFLTVLWLFWGTSSQLDVSGNFQQEKGVDDLRRWTASMLFQPTVMDTLLRRCINRLNIVP